MKRMERLERAVGEIQRELHKRFGFVPYDALDLRSKKMWVEENVAELKNGKWQQVRYEVGAMAGDEMGVFELNHVSKEVE